MFRYAPIPALAAIVAVMLTGCTSPSASSGGGTLSVPTDQKIGGTDGDMAALQGVLHASRTGDRACFWVDGPNGRAFIVTRPGSYGRNDLTLVEADAKTPAKAGTAYLFWGAPGSTTPLAGCSGTGRPWYTGQITEADPQYSQATLPPETKRN